jgi:hypothetical protein
LQLLIIEENNMPKGVYERKLKTLQERFEGKYIIDESTGCWLWQGATSSGYGVMGRGRAGEGTIRASRVSYMIHKGPVKDEEIMCHKCHNPLCVNPEHIYAGTRSDNQMDRVKDGTSNRGERHGNSKLTEEQVREIRAYPKGYILTARKFGVSPQLIGRIRKRELWYWLE